MLWRTKYEKRQKTKSADQTLPDLRKAFCVAEKMGKSLG
jgi:hypothetical protein